jgi:hypothetical protein
VELQQVLPDAPDHVVLAFFAALLRRVRGGVQDQDAQLDALVAADGRGERVHELVVEPAIVGMAGERIDERAQDADAAP